MTHDEEKRVIVTEPNGDQRETIHTESSYVPNETHYVPVVREPRGISGASVALIVIASIAVVSLFFVLFMNSQREEDINANKDVATRQEPAQQQPIIVQQPAQQQPIVVQQPASQPPIVVGGSDGSSASTSTIEVDMKIQTEIDKRLADDSTFSAYDITATVLDGKATLIGTVDTDDMKMKIEKMVRDIKGVRNVDNKLIVTTM